MRRALPGRSLSIGCCLLILVLAAFTALEPATTAYASQNGQQGPNRPGPGGNQGQRPGGGNRPNPGGQKPGGPPPSRPNPPKPNPSRPNPSRPNPPRPNPPKPNPPRPPAHRPPPRPVNRPRPHYSWGDGGNGWRLRHFFNNDMLRINRARRPHFIVGGYFPHQYVTYLQPIPPDIITYLPPVPPGYAMGYYDGYTVVYDPTTYLIVSVLDLFRY